MKTMLSKLMAIAISVAMLAVASVPTAFADVEQKVIKVACVGDSITAGTGNITYPIYLQEILGDGYEVKNFGLGGAAVQHKADSDGKYFWYDSEQYLSSLEYDADVVFVMMGTNDVKSNLLSLKKYFREDYYNYLIKPYLDKGIEVVVMTSPCAYYYMMADHNIINTTIRQYQMELAEENGLKLIDMNTATSNMRECFPDGLHGNASGYTIIAQTIYEQYFGGDMAKVTVTTQPGALVSAGRVGINADTETGEAVLKLLPGTHDLAITLDGYKSVYGNIEVVAGESKCAIAMSEGGKNVAVGSKVTASSTTGDFKENLAADGSMDTRWQATWGADQWLTLDMGKVNKIGGVRLLWEPAYGKGYDVLVSADGVNYTTVASVTDGDGATDEIFFNVLDAQYIKLEFNALGSPYGYSLYEVEVMESDGTSLTENCGTVIPEIVKTGLSLWVYIAIAAAVVVIIAVIIIAMASKKKKAAKAAELAEEPKL